MKEKHTKMDRAAASRIQRDTCKKNGGKTSQNSFASRAMSAAYKNYPLDDAASRRHTSKSSPHFFQPSDSDSDSNSESNDHRLLLALGLGVAAIGAGLAFYAAAKEEEEQPKSCCQRWCQII